MKHGLLAGLFYHHWKQEILKEDFAVNQKSTVLELF
jgi:hypothetical protein